MTNNGPIFDQSSLTDLEGANSSASYAVCDELMYKPSELPPLPFFVDDIPSVSITPLPPALPVAVNSLKTDEELTVTDSSTVTQTKEPQSRKRKLEKPTDYREEIDLYRSLTKASKEDQDSFKRIKKFILKSQTEKLTPAQTDEMRGLKNMFSARLSRARKIEEKESLEATKIELTQENERLKNDNASLRQRINELETLLKFSEENTIASLLRTQSPQVLGQYYIGLQRSSSLSATPASADGAVRAQADAASLKPS